MATAVGGICLNLMLNKESFSKSINAVTKHVESAVLSMNKDFTKTSEIMKKSTEKVAEAVNEKVTEQIADASKQVQEKTKETVKSITPQVEAVKTKVSETLLNDFEKISNKSSDEVCNDFNKIETKANKMSGTLKKLGSAVIAAFSVAAIKNFGQQCIESAAQVNAANSQFEQTFGSMQAQAKSAIQTVAKESGILETRLQGVGTSIYAFAKTTGMDSANALNMMQEALQVTADSAAYYDRSLEDTAESLKSFLKGNFENDSALGLSCTETTRNTAANKLYGKSFTELSESQKQLTLLEMVKDANKLSGALGQASRESDGWENVTGNLKESWNQLLAVVGKPILQVATNIVQKLSSAISKLTEYAKGAVSALSELFNWDGDDTANSISATANSAQNLSSEAENSSSSLENIADSAEKAKNSVAGFDKLNVISSSDKSESSSSDVSSGSGTTTITNNGAISSVTKKSDKLFQNKTFESFKSALINVKNAILSIGTSWKNIWNNGTGDKVLENISSLLKTTFNTIEDIAGAFKSAWDRAELGNSVVQSFIDKWNRLVELIDTVGNTFKQVWNDGTGERIWTNILEIIRNCNNFTETLRTKIKKAWEKNDTGKKIWENILGIVEDISNLIDEMSEDRLNWLENLDINPVAEAVGKLTDNFRNLIKVCGDKLKQIYTTILLPLSKWTIEKAVPKIVEALATALKLFSNIINRISISALKGIATAILSIFTAVKSFEIAQSFKRNITIIKSSFATLKNALTSHPYAVLIAAVASAVIGLVTAIKEANKQKLKDLGFTDATEKMNNFVSTISDCKDTIADLCSNINSSLSDTSIEMGVIDDYKERLDELLSKANLTDEEQAELITIGDYFSNKYPDFKTAWEQYIKQDDSGKVQLIGNADEIKASLDELITKYKQLASSEALSELAQENSKAIVSSNKDLTEAGVALRKAQQEMEKFKEDWDLTDEHLDILLNSPDFYTWQNKGSTKNSNAGDLKKQYNALLTSLNDAEAGYDSTAEKVAQLKENSSDLSKMQSVVNGNYNDAAAVLMAYNSGLINTTDIQNSQWESLSKLEEAAKDSGENLVFGLTNGVSSYLDEVKETGLTTADTYLSSLNGKEGLDEHSPSKKTYQSGVFAVTGFVNGVSSMIDKVRKPLTQMIKMIEIALNPVATVFSNTFSRIWSVIRPHLNTALSNLETFINGFVSGINKMLSGVDTVANSIGKLFGQEWHAGQLDKVSLPRLATGGLVKAPTLAVVGDNAGANTGDPEVIAPLSKLEGMLNTSNGEDTVILSEILYYLKKLYEMFVIFRNNGGNYYQFIAQINGSDIFNEIVKQNELYKNRHNGKSAFA